MNSPTAAEGLQILSQGDVERARGIFSELIANGSELPQAFYGLGVVCMTKMEFDLAVQHFRSSLQLSPDRSNAVCSNALYQLGVIEQRKGNRSGAVQHWQDSLQSNQNNAASKERLREMGAPFESPEHLTPLPERPGGIVPGYDLYGMLQRSNSGVEREIARLLDEVQAIMNSKRQNVSAYIGGFLFLWVLAAIAIFVCLQQRNAEPLALVVLGLALLITLLAALKIRSDKIKCERYVFVRKWGLFSTSSRPDHLWQMTRDKWDGPHQSLLNRMTNDGWVVIGGRHFKGFFTKEQMETIQKNFVQLSMLMPTDRDILTAIGVLKNIRSQDK